MDAKIGIKEPNRAAVSEELAKHLADEFLLYTKTRKAHWNVEGIDFMSKHEFFETQYKQLAKIVDAVAERIRKLGHYAPATMQKYLELTHLSEEMPDKNDSATYIKELLSDHEQIIMHYRANVEPFMDEYHDAGTSDFITALIEEHETMAWFLRAHLGK